MVIAIKGKIPYTHGKDQGFKGMIYIVSKQVGMFFHARSWMKGDHSK